MSDDLAEQLTTHARVERLILEGKREDDEMRYKVRALRQHATLIEDAAAAILFLRSEITDLTAENADLLRIRDELQAQLITERTTSTRA